MHSGRRTEFGLQLQFDGRRVVIPIGEIARRVPIFPFVVYLLIALNVYVFVQELRAADIDRFIDRFATIPTTSRTGSCSRRPARRSGR